jgi:hypothetical protein
MNKFWQVTQIISVLTIGMGTMGMAQANGSSNYTQDCTGGGGSNSNCYTWTFNSSADVTNGVRVGGTPGLTATPTGVSNTGGGNTLLQSAYVGSYSGGLGVTNANENGTSPNHAIDNSGNVDSILFSFSSAVNLTSFNAGYVYGDSDYSVLAYIGGGALPAVPALIGNTYASLLASGWALIGNYAAGSSTGAHDFANSTYSSYWLIGALNSFVGGDPAKVGNDFFKILSVAGCDCSTAPAGTPGCGGGGSHGTPEPGTLLLMGAGLFGLTRMRAATRRRMQRSAA